MAVLMFASHKLLTLIEKKNPLIVSNMVLNHFDASLENAVRSDEINFTYAFGFENYWTNVNHVDPRYTKVVT